ncbi:hypothetical protein pipiens_014640 [Culex pipiens pipiens]|uniref:Uncharacterized protein n=1 Tax=Culex pipiens pipiens TaxID=38569 RepID=A0ABD1CTU6_CULPP
MIKWILLTLLAYLQLISRNGLIVSDIQQTKQRAKDAILEHGLAIGNPQNPCLVAANDEAIRRATQAARDLSVSAETVYNVVRLLPIDRFYSVARTFQNRSSEFQWTVLGKLGEANAVTNLQELQADLAFHRIRREAFQRWDEISRNYIFNMDLLIEEDQQCF